MKAVIFNGAKEGDLTIKAIEKNIADQLTKERWEVEPIELRNMQIANCIGCFGCWVKTPGTCVINDDGRETTRKAIQSDLMVWLTPVTFGGYSSELKKALDRIIPILLPYFQVIPRANPSQDALQEISKAPRHRSARTWRRL